MYIELQHRCFLCAVKQMLTLIVVFTHKVMSVEVLDDVIVLYKEARSKICICVA